MKLIVGLGNPGRDYRDTRHNAGFMVLEALADRHAITGPRAKFNASVLEGIVAGEKVMLMQPTTYMNRSGSAVAEAANFYKVDRGDLLIVVDETALPIGSLRLRARGTDGGHNGLADIARALGTDEYPRLRVGIGEPQVDGHRIAKRDYVLGRFTDDQRAEFDRTLPRACDTIEAWLTEPIENVMSRTNTRVAETNDNEPDE